MAIQWKRNSRYPSVTRPGVFPRIQEFDDTGVDILEDTWFKLTGIDEEEINKFKFSLGTWVQLSRRNRRVAVLSADAANTITYPITSDEAEGTITEPKPSEHPPGFLNDLSPGAWAESIEDNLEDLLTWPRGAVGITGGYDLKSGPSEEEGILRYENMRVALFGVSSGGPYFQDPFVKSVGAGVKGYEPKPNKRNANIKTLLHAITGEWEERYERQPWVVYKWKKEYDSPTRNRYTTYLKPNIIKYPEDNKIGAYSVGYQWQWQPSNSRITDPDTGAKLFGEYGSYEISGVDLRRKMALKSTFVRFKLIEEQSTKLPIKKGLVVFGQGSGHGVGMSQWGAKYMASKGQKFEKILKHFYRGVNIKPFRRDFL